jgi:DNA-binding CsgD family transcriptional regulator
MTSKHLQAKLDSLLVELRSIGVEETPSEQATQSGVSIRPIYLDRLLARRIVDGIAAAAEALAEPEGSSETSVGSNDLSDRQKEILTWVALGKSNSVIASILGISPHTVDTHLRRTFERLGTTDRTVAAIKGIEAGLISPIGLKAA